MIHPNTVNDTFMSWCGLRKDCHCLNAWSDKEVSKLHVNDVLTWQTVDTSTNQRSNSPQSSTIQRINYKILRTMNDSITSAIWSKSTCKERSSWAFCFIQACRKGRKCPIPSYDTASALKYFWSKEIKAGNWSHYKSAC